MPLHFYLLYPFLRPYYPGRRPNVHLEVAPTSQPPPLVSAIPYLSALNLIPRSLLTPGVPHRIPKSVVSLVCLPPFVSLYLLIGPCQPLRVLPSVGIFLYMPSYLALLSAPPSAGLNLRPSP